MSFPLLHPRSPQAGRSLLNDETAFENPHLEVHSVTVTSPTRPTPFRWTVCHRKAAVVIVPQTAEGKFLLVRQERVPIRATIWEFPAGQIDEAADQDAALIRATGLRELREESGYELAEGGELRALGHFFPSCGFTDEHSHFLLARPVLAGAHGPELDANEAISEARAFSGRGTAGDDRQQRDPRCQHAGRLCAPGRAWTYFPGWNNSMIAALSLKNFKSSRKRSLSWGRSIFSSRRMPAVNRICSMRSGFSKALAGG